MRITVPDDGKIQETVMGRKFTPSEAAGIELLPHERPLPEYVYVRRNAWWFLHSYRGCDLAWFAEWETTIPTGRCNCKEDYRKILEKLPPDFSTPEAFFQWGVELHNLVNAKLIAEGDTTKRIVSLDEAYSLWRNGDDNSGKTMDS
jgi:hypothetical protein